VGTIEKLRGGINEMIKLENYREKRKKRGERTPQIRNGENAGGGADHLEPGVKEKKKVTAGRCLTEKSEEG